MTKTKVDTLLGFGGVDPQETSQAVRWGRMLETPMLMIALWIMLEWYLSARGLLTADARQLSDWIIWGFFLLETSLLTHLCNDRLHHLRRNWANVLIIVLAFPPLYEVTALGSLRMVRLLFLLGLFVHNVGMVRAVLAQNHLGKTLFVVLLFVTGGGILISSIDPAIQSPWDGMWWAWVTVTTVGYGGVVPSSGAGRVFASILMLLGISMLSLITANISAYLLSRSAEKEIRYEQRELKKLLQLEDRLDSIEAKLDRLLGGTSDRQD